MRPQANLESELAHVRGTVITALKYTISDQPQQVDIHLSKYIGDFMGAISDPDLVSGQCIIMHGSLVDLVLYS